MEGQGAGSQVAEHLATLLASGQGGVPMPRDVQYGDSAYWPLVFALAIVAASFPLFTLFRRLPHASINDGSSYPPAIRRMTGPLPRMPGAPLKVTPCDPDAPFTPLTTRRYFRMAHVGNFRHNGRRRRRPQTRSGAGADDTDSSFASDDEPIDSSGFKLVMGRIERGEEEPWSGRSALKGGREKDRVRVESSSPLATRPALDLAPASPNLSPYPSPEPVPASPDLDDSVMSPTLYPGDDLDKRVRLEEPLASKASLVALRKTFLYATSPAVFMRNHMAATAPAPSPVEDSDSSEEEECDPEQPEASGSHVAEGEMESLEEEGAEEEPAAASGLVTRRARQHAAQRRARIQMHQTTPSGHRQVPVVRRRSSSRSGRPLSSASAARSLSPPSHPHPAPPAPSTAAGALAIAQSQAPLKIYKRTPPSSRSDRRRFLEQQSREAATAAAAAAVLLRINKAPNGTVAGPSQQRAAPMSATGSRPAPNGHAPVEGTSSAGAGLQPVTPSRGSSLAAPIANPVVYPPLPPPYSEATEPDTIIDAAGPEQSVEEEEVPPAEVEVKVEDEQEDTEDAPSRDQRRNGYLEGLWRPEPSEPPSVSDGAQATDSASTDSDDVWEDAVVAQPRPGRTSRSNSNRHRHPSPHRPESQSPPPPVTFQAKNPKVAMLQSRGSLRSVSPPNRPSTPDVLMQRAAAAAAQEDGESPVSKKEAHSTAIDGAPVKRVTSAPSPLRSGEQAGDATELNIPRRGSSVSLAVSSKGAREKPYANGDSLMVSMVMKTPYAASTDDSPRPITRSMSNRALRATDDPPRRTSPRLVSRSSPNSTPSPPPASPLASAKMLGSKTHPSSESWKKDGIMLGETKRKWSDEGVAMVRTRSGRSLSSAA